MGYNRKTTTYLNPSVLDALGEAESVEELYAALTEALLTYKDASSKTKRQWRKRAEQVAAHLRTKLIVLPALLLALLLATVGWAGDKPLTLILQPQTGLMAIDGQPFRVTATALLLDPKHVNQCPGWVIWWGDGEKSTQAPTVCRLPAEPADRQTWTATHYYRQPFVGRVEVATMDMLTDGAKPIRATARLALR